MILIKIHITCLKIRIIKLAFFVMIRRLKRYLKQREVGTFSGNVNDNKELQNMLDPNNYRWFLCANNSNWAPFRIDDYKSIDSKLKDYCLFKRYNIYEDWNFTIDCKQQLSIINKNVSNSKIVKKIRMSQKHYKIKLLQQLNIISNCNIFKYLWWYFYKFSKRLFFEI